MEGVADPAAWLQPPTLIRAWVAEFDGEIVGHVLITAPASSDDAVQLWHKQNPQAPDGLAVLGRLFVVSTARSRTVGERLVRAAMTSASEHDLRLLLDVMDKDTAAIRLYKRLGWERIGTATHRFGDGEQVTAFCYVAPSADR